MPDKWATDLAKQINEDDTASRWNPRHRWVGEKGEVITPPSPVSAPTLGIPPEGINVSARPYGYAQEEVYTIKPDYSVWHYNEYVGDLNPETGEVTPAERVPERAQLRQRSPGKYQFTPSQLVKLPTVEEIKYQGMRLAYPFLKGLETTLTPFTTTGMATWGGREAVKEAQEQELWKERGYEPTPPMLKPVPGTIGEAVLGEYAPGGEKYGEYHELPLWQQLLYESPAWAAISAVPASALAGWKEAGKLPTAARIPVRAALAPLAGYEWVVGKTISATYRAVMSASLRRNLRSWAISTGREIPKATEDAFVKSALGELSPKFLAKETVKTLFKPTKGGFTVTEAGVGATEKAANEAIRKSPLLLGVSTKAPVPKAEVGMPVTPVVEGVKPPTLVAEEAGMATNAQKIKTQEIALYKALVNPATGKITPAYRRLAQNITGQKTIDQMTADEADEFIEALSRFPEKKWSRETGKWIPQSIPITKAIVPENYFGLKFGEPTPVKYLTSQNFYATKLGVSPLTEPLELAKQKLDLVFPAWSKAVDIKLGELNKVFKVTFEEKLIAFRNNKPTRASTEMAKLLNKYEDIPVDVAIELGEEKVKVFSWFRNLSRTILNAENQVRELLNMPAIPHRQAYFRHIATETVKEIWGGNYSLPSDLAYWSSRIVGKKVFNPMEIQREIADDLLEYFSKDLGYVIKSMLWTGLKEIYLSQPLKAFTTQLNVLSKGMMPFSSLPPAEMAKATAIQPLPASTHKWVTDYVNTVIKGQQTEFDASINRLVTQTGIGGVFDKLLGEFGRSIGTRPVTKMAQFAGRLIISATIGTKPRQIIRNLHQSIQNLALYGIRPTLQAFLPADKTLTRLLNNSMFLKTYAKFEELPTGAMAKAERAWLWSYGKSAIFNARGGERAAYHGTLKYITDPKNKDLGWASPERTYTEPKGFLYPEEEANLLREMEFGAGCTQYQYIAMGMPEIFRHKTLIPFTRLQSWWMNYFAKFNREAIGRFWNGSVGWNPDLKLPWTARLNWLKYVILGGAVLTAMGYKRSFYRDVLPHWYSPAGQFAVGAYSYVIADEDWEREKAKKTMFYSVQAFVPGLIDYFMWKELWEGERPLSSVFFYTEEFPPDMPTWGIPFLEEIKEAKQLIKDANKEMPKFREQLGQFIPAEDDIEGYTYGMVDLGADIRATIRGIPEEEITLENGFDPMVIMYKDAQKKIDSYYKIPESQRQAFILQQTPESVWSGAYLALWGKLTVTGWVSENPQTIVLIRQLVTEHNIPAEAVPNLTKLREREEAAVEREQVGVEEQERQQTIEAMREYMREKTTTPGITPSTPTPTPTTPRHRWVD